jgi:type II secretory pathway pseudopilin PulG
MATETRRSSDWIAECGVVLATVALIGSFGVPGLGAAMERSRANEAVEYLTGVRLAQERHRLRHGRYAAELAALDLHRPLPSSFRVGHITAHHEAEDDPSWAVTLTRRPTRLIPESYTVTFTERGFDASRSTVARHFDLEQLAPQTVHDRR